jgi:hypothetical protein
MLKQNKNQEMVKNIYERKHTNSTHKTIRRMNSKFSSDNKNISKSRNNSKIHTSLKSTNSFIPMSTSRLTRHNTLNSIVQRKIESKQSIGLDTFGNELEEILPYYPNTYRSLNKCERINELREEEDEEGEIILQTSQWYTNNLPKVLKTETSANSSKRVLPKNRHHSNRESITIISIF